MAILNSHPGPHLGGPLEERADSPVSARTPSLWGLSLLVLRAVRLLRMVYLRQHLRLTESEEKEKEALQLQIRKEKVSNVTLTGRWASEAADVCRLHRYRAA
ncbi:hypothetical protein FJT64_008437 [Amphibalanus amphitrite]|uniref:Uncharacterized protein n=1 Tax=Amphibalanus amphitrite TaxID=1232801 RepID=A0A6A4VVD8_AMPAM|nr:hypothetical protein FJT64_008437 [Amphibalanus amphitrite]